MVTGRTESGLLAASLFAGGDDPDRRVLLALPYSAERTGKGLTLEASLVEHGEAPLDRLPRVMEGVAKRTETDLGEPTEIEVIGSEERLVEYLGAFNPDLLDPDLPPLAPPVSGEGSESEPEELPESGAGADGAPSPTAAADGAAGPTDPEESHVRENASVPRITGPVP